MRPRSQPPRTPSKLPVSVHHRVNMYAVAAGAAGVGMLALAQPVEGKIVYTPAHKNAIAGIQLDLNHDGIADFKLCNSQYNYFHCSRKEASRPPGLFSALLAIPLNTLNGVVGGRDASALVAGKPIGDKRIFSKSDSRMASALFSGSSIYGGQWLNVTNRYLGFKFVITGKIHYGWARLNVHYKTPRTAILTGYAYETVPGKPIIAGKTKGPDSTTASPASLGHLAAGASAIPAWRSGR